MATVANWRYDYVPDVGARYLLQHEDEGFAIDATTYDTDLAAAYVGGPVGGSVSIHADTISSKPNVPLDAVAGLLKGASPLTQAGTSAKMVHHVESPYVRWSPHNTLVQSQTLATSTSTFQCSVTSDTSTAPDGTTTADTVTASTNGDAVLWKDGTAVSGMSCTFSVYLKAAIEDWAMLELSDGGAKLVNVFFDLVNGVAGDTDEATWVLLNYGIENAGNGWWRCFIAAVVDDTAPQNLIALAEADGDRAVGSGDTILVWGMQCNRGHIPTSYLATTDAVRIGIPQSYNATTALYGILVEPAATNLLSYSNFTEPPWDDFASASTINTSIAPDGTLTAATFIPDAGNTVHVNFYNDSDATYSSGTVVTYSVYLKAGVTRYAQIILGSDSAEWITCLADLQAGAITDTEAGADGTILSTSIQSVGNGWYRLSITGSLVTAFAYTQTAVGSYNAATIGTVDAFGNLVWDPAGNESIYTWGAQLETGSVATSYIPTVAASATRAVDDLQVALSSIPANNAAFTVYSSASRKAAITGYASAPRYWYVGDSTGNEHVNMNTSTLPVERFETFSTDGGSVLVTIDDGSAAAANAVMQLSGAAEQDNFAVSGNGASVVTDTSVDIPTDASMDRLVLGDRGQGSRKLNGHIYKLVYVPRRVIDADLPTWRYEA